MQNSSRNWSTRTFKRKKKSLKRIELYCRLEIAATTLTFTFASTVLWMIVLSNNVFITFANSWYLSKRKSTNNKKNIELQWNQQISASSKSWHKNMLMTYAAHKVSKPRKPSRIVKYRAKFSFIEICLPFWKHFLWWNVGCQKDFITSAIAKRCDIWLVDLRNGFLFWFNYLWELRSSVV